MTQAPPLDEHARVVVVGAGECGGRAAETLRSRGFEGTIVLLGDEGLGPYERPPLSKQALTAADGPAPRFALTQDQLAALSIDARLDDPAVTVDRDTRIVTTRSSARLAYDALVFATGARARSLPIPGGEHAVTLRTMGDALALRASLQPGTTVVVIGGGFIGLEVAASARKLGCTVTVVEVVDRLMARAVPATIAAVVEDRHRDEGVGFRLGVGVRELTRGTNGLTVHLSDGAMLDADVVLAAVGSVPNTELAAGCGLAIDNGIAVDEQLRTTDPAVFAAGDCVSFPHALFAGQRIRLESWQSAIEQGAIAAANVVGGTEVAGSVPWFWSDQYDLTLQVSGLPATATQRVMRARHDGARIEFGTDGDGVLLSAAGVSVGGAVARDIRVAQQLIARRAVIDPAQLADPDVALKSLFPNSSTNPNPESDTHP